MNRYIKKIKKFVISQKFDFEKIKAAFFACKLFEKIIFISLYIICFLYVVSILCFMLIIGVGLIDNPKDVVEFIVVLFLNLLLAFSLVITTSLFMIHIANNLIVAMKNDIGMIKEVKVGFSWIAFFFGGWPFFFRGIPIYGIIWVILSIITFGISNLILMFIINKQTAHYYLENGYKPVGDGWDIASIKWGISIDNSTDKL